MTTEATTRSLTWSLLLAAAIMLLGIMVVLSVRSIVRAMQDHPAAAADTAVTTTVPGAEIPRDAAAALPPPQPAPPPAAFTDPNPPVDDPARQRRIDYRNTVKRLREQARESPAGERAKIEARIQQLEESNAVPQ